MRQRKRTLWPDMETGRVTMVVSKPLLNPVQAERPASGFPKVESIVSLYPPTSNVPPAAVTSWNAPPSTETSRTPPSKPDSKSRFCLKVSFTPEPVIAIAGESSRLSLTTAGSST
jgi:hypothetical protein